VLPHVRNDVFVEAVADEVPDIDLERVGKRTASCDEAMRGGVDVRG
jgi:hypothetical protein